MVERNRTHRGFKIFLLIIGFLLLILLNNSTKEKLVSLVDRRLNKVSELQLDTEYNGENLNYFKDTLIRWKDNKITYYNKDGSESWTKEFDFMYPDIYFGQDNIYIMDKSTGDIYIMDNKGDTISRIQTGQNIFNLKESNNNYFVHSKEEGIEHLLIFDREGNNIEKLETSDYFLTYSMNQDASKYLYSTISASEGLSSIINVKDIDTKENYYIEKPNEVIFFSEFIDDRIIALTNKNLYMYEKDNMTWTYYNEGIQDILVKGKEIYILYNNKIDILDLNGQVIKSIDLSIEAKKFVNLDKSIGVFGQDDLVILQNHKEILKYIGQEEILKVTANEKSIAIHYVDKVDIFKNK